MTLTPARVRLLTGALAVVALSLGGCASTPDDVGAAATPIPASETSTPSQAAESPAPRVVRTAKPNDQACIRFAENHNELANLVYDGKGELTNEGYLQAQLDAVALIDKASLEAEGDIAERMKSAVSLIPANPRDMASPYDWEIGEAYNQAIDRVFTACEVGGIAYGMKDVPLAPEILRQ